MQKVTSSIKVVEGKLDMEITILSSPIMYWKASAVFVRRKPIQMFNVATYDTN